MKQSFLRFAGVIRVGTRAGCEVDEIPTELASPV